MAKGTICTVCGKAFHAAPLLMEFANTPASVQGFSVTQGGADAER
jgi:hypothetical protein